MRPSADFAHQTYMIETLKTAAAILVIRTFRWLGWDLWAEAVDKRMQR
jgi:hypothetical protein